MTNGTVWRAQAQRLGTPVSFRAVQTSA